MRRRVVVTGVGIASALGPNRETTWSALLSGRSAVCATSFGKEVTGVPKVAARCDYSLLPPIKLLIDPSRRKLLKFAAPPVHFALAAIREALCDAKLDPFPKDRGIGMSTGINPYLPVPEEEHAPGLMLIATHPIGSCTTPAMLLGGVHGPTMANVDNCCAGSHAIGYAAELIELGKAEIMIAGAADALTNVAFIQRFNALGALSPEEQPELACRPFDKHRNGTVLGEGAAYLILESDESVAKSGVRPLAYLGGFRTGSDGYAATDPEPSGELLGEAIRRAAADADVAPAEIGYVNVHGTGTTTNDLSEAAALRHAFGDDLPNVLCGSTKQAVGHLNAASGAIEAAFAVLALRDQVVPPHLNTTELDPACAGIVLPGLVAENKPLKATASLNLGFGGFYSTLVFTRAY